MKYCIGRIQHIACYFRLSVLIVSADMSSSYATAETPPYVSIPPIVNGNPNPSYNGTGCPTGSARAIVSPDLQTFTLIFDEFTVSVSGAKVKEQKDCKILVMFDFPQGWSYSLFRMDYRGFYDLSAEATGSQHATYFFRGHAKEALIKTHFVGPMTGNYTLSDSLGINDSAWSPCKEKRAGLNIKTELTAAVGKKNPTGHAYITIDSADGHVENIYSLGWRRCNEFTNEDD